MLSPHSPPLNTVKLSYQLPPLLHLQKSVSSTATSATAQETHRPTPAASPFSNTNHMPSLHESSLILQHPDPGGFSLFSCPPTLSPEHTRWALWSGNRKAQGLKAASVLAISLPACQTKAVLPITGGFEFQKENGQEGRLIES